VAKKGCFADEQRLGRCGEQFLVTMEQKYLQSEQMELEPEQKEMVQPAPKRQPARAQDLLANSEQVNGT